MEVIVDTNVIMDAIFGQPENEECWEILRLIRTNAIKLVVSEGLLREYIFVPTQIVAYALYDRLKMEAMTKENIKQVLNNAHTCSTDVAKIMFNNNRCINVTSNLKISGDSDDDKIINLAIDSNCGVIITKNLDDFRCVEEKHIKTRNNKPITVYNPEQFTNYFKVIEHFHANQRR